MKLDKKEPLVESQLFIMELARELSRICQVSSSLPSVLYHLQPLALAHIASVSQRSNILCHIWAGEDIWPANVCRDFMVEWAAELETRVQV